MGVSLGGVIGVFWQSQPFSACLDSATLTPYIPWFSWATEVSAEALIDLNLFHRTMTHGVLLPQVQPALVCLVALTFTQRSNETEQGRCTKTWPSRDDARASLFAALSEMSSPRRSPPRWAPTNRPPSCWAMGSHYSSSEGVLSTQPTSTRRCSRRALKAWLVRLPASTPLPKGCHMVSVGVCRATRRSFLSVGSDGDDAWYCAFNPAFPVCVAR